MPSVVPRVKMISRGSAALMKRAIFSALARRPRWLPGSECARRGECWRFRIRNIAAERRSRPAASASWRHCRNRSAVCRGLLFSGWEIAPNRLLCRILDSLYRRQDWKRTDCMFTPTALFHHAGPDPVMRKSRGRPCCAARKSSRRRRTGSTLIRRVTSAANA